MDHPPPVRLAILDHLRGLAALAVCLFHFSGGMSPVGHDHSLARAFSWGHQGVTVFFVISGFVIPLALQRAHYHWSGAGRFLARRMLRLLPPSWAALLLTLGQWWVAERLLHADTGYLQYVTPKLLLQNITYAVPFFGHSYHRGWLNNVYWTLSVEMQYYLLLALLFPLLCRGWKWLLGIGILLAGGSVLLTPWLHQAAGPMAEQNFLLVFTPIFWLGILTSFAHTGALKQRVYWPLLAGFAAGCWALLDLPTTCFALATALSIHRAPAARFAPTRWLGTVSYSIYLIHLPVSVAVAWILPRVIPAAVLAWPGLPLALVLVATLLASPVFYRLVELPSIQLAHRLTQRADD